MRLNKRVLMIVINVISLLILGIVLQIGGAYLVNAAVIIFGDGSATMTSQAAMEYSRFMETIRSIEPRQFVHIIFVAPLVEEIVFRLIFLRAGKMVLPFWAANIVQAALFAIYHNVSFQRVYAFVMGLIIGFVFHYCPIILRNVRSVPSSETKDRMSGSAAQKNTAGILDLPDCIIGAFITFILHMVINSTGLLLVPFMSGDIAVALQIAIGLLLMGIACAVCIMLWRISVRVSSRDFS